ncbi:MAG: hypothetical protein ACI828_002552, partial [Flavobacteriales bacterium]
TTTFHYGNEKYQEKLKKLIITNTLTANTS